jgi:hypothetical protein
MFTPEIPFAIVKSDRVLAERDLSHARTVKASLYSRLASIKKL